MRTVFDKKEINEFFTFEDSSVIDSDVNVTIEIMGQNVERSYEDRSVYVCMTRGEDHLLTTWLNGEDAIELGMMLIDHGKFALEANMINHQRIHMYNVFQQYLDEGRVEEVVFTVTDESPVNYGSGFRAYLIKPTWKDGMSPRYNEDFEFEEVIYWSPFDEEYQQQLDRYTRGEAYSFNGYDREQDLAEFNAACDSMQA